VLRRVDRRPADVHPHRPRRLGQIVELARRDDGDRTEFVTMSLWESQDAIRAFAGDNIEVAFFPDDDRFLVDRETTVTHFEVLREASGHAMLRVQLETGRTHQIRAHLAAIGHPVYADPLYGTALPGRRLWLHAERLSFEHPVTGEHLSFESSIPEDLREAALALDASLALW
jgi:hypothetical protein